MKTIHITKDQARNYMINYHNINTSSKYEGLDGIKQLFDKVGSIQFDPLNVVGYNADLVLQSRFNNYKADLLYDALYNTRILVDGWDKQMCIYQAKEFPFFHKIRDLRAQASFNGLKKYFDFDPTNLANEIVSIIKEKGPVFSKDINLGAKRESRWGSTKESSASLDYMFHKGIIGVKKKNKAIRQFDLIENLLPSNYLISTHMDEDTHIKEFILRRIKSSGLVMNKNNDSWSGYVTSKKTTRTKYLEMLLEEERIVEVRIDSLKYPFYAPTSFLDYTDNLIDTVSFIAPLDNLIWDRELVHQVFDFEYRWEVYTPKSKRKYGYYVLPVLYKDKMIGRIEFSHFKQKEALKVIGFFMEEKSTLIDIEVIKLALDKFAAYLGAPKVVGMSIIKKALN